MKKRMSTREIVLLSFLMVLVVYYFGISIPLNKKQNELNSRMSSVQSSISTLTPQLTQMNTWQKKLDQVYEKTDNPISIPEYDNINKIIVEMHAIFDDSNKFKLDFSEPTLVESIVTREIRVSYEVPTYEIAKTKIENVYESKNNYQITDINIVDNDSSYSVNLVMSAHEYLPDSVSFQ